MKFDFTAKNRVIPNNQAPATDSVPALPPGSGRIVAVIGTAGRDKTKPMTHGLWLAMCEDLLSRVSPDDELVSGGAAWADHLAVHAMLSGWVRRLTLYFPAPLNNEGFQGPRGSAASAANFYHHKFSSIIGINSIQELITVSTMPGVRTHAEPVAHGYGAMFSRNKKVAQAVNGVIAYTFGEGDQPADGGTLNTWNQIKSADRAHIALDSLAKERSREQMRSRP